MEGLFICQNINDTQNFLVDPKIIQEEECIGRNGKKRWKHTILMVPKLKYSFMHV